MCTYYGVLWLCHCIDMYTSLFGSSLPWNTTAELGKNTTFEVGVTTTTELGEATADSH